MGGFAGSCGLGTFFLRIQRRYVAKMTVTVMTGMTTPIATFAPVESLPVGSGAPPPETGASGAGVAVTAPESRDKRDAGNAETPSVGGGARGSKSLPGRDVGQLGAALVDVYFERGVPDGLFFDHAVCRAPKAARGDGVVSVPLSTVWLNSVSGFLIRPATHGPVIVPAHIDVALSVKIAPSSE